MRIGVLSDAHGNPLGLSSILNLFDREEVETVVFLGDAVGYLPDWTSVIDSLAERVDHWVLGNHDAMAAGMQRIDPSEDELYRIASPEQPLTSANLRLISGLPMQLTLQSPIGDLLFVHGSPESPLNGRVYPDSQLDPGELSQWAGVFMGNTHRPFITLVGNCQVVNVGSCGLPRDIGRQPSGAIWDVGTAQPRIIRTSLDVDALRLRYQGRAHETVLEVFSRNEKTSGRQK